VRTDIIPKILELLLTQGYDSFMTINSKETEHLNKINLFGIRFKPWQGIVAGILIQMLFTKLFTGSISEVIAGFGGLLIIGSIIVGIKNRLSK